MSSLTHRRIAVLLTVFVVISATTPSLLATTEQVTFSEHVAPILYNNCVTCHRPDQVAPMSLRTYKETRPWAKSIARAVKSGDMPPWSGESDRHTFRDALTLEQSEIETIVAWVDQGATEGDPSKVPTLPEFHDGWRLGEPDRILELQRVEVPAAGEDLFLKEWVELNFEETKWIQAIEFLPGDPRSTHHFQATYTTKAAGGEADSEFAASRGPGTTGVLGIWTAGMPPYVFPKGMGRVLAPGTRVLVDSHYHPFGEATSDVTKIGIHFGEGEFEHEVTTIPAVNTGIRIPPNASDYAAEAFFIFDHDVQILAFSPHMHVRGKAMRYDIRYPDGTGETLLDVPNYDYNWQWLYYPTEPIDVPAGSRIDVTAVWDNSETNPANPDPSQEIIYRGDTFNEMFVGFMEVAETTSKYRRPFDPKAKLTQLLDLHDSGDRFLATGFLPFGLALPEEGLGWLYAVQGGLMTTVSLDDIEWDGKSLTVHTQLPTPEASAIDTYLNAKIADDGLLKGTLQIGDGGPKIPFAAAPHGVTGGAATGAGAGGQ